MVATVVTSENLAEFNASKMGAPSAPDSAVAVETTEPVETETHSEGDEQFDADDEAQQQEEQKSNNPKIDKRIQVIAKQREEAKREAAREREAREATESELKELKAKLNPQPEAKAEGKPLPSQFSDAYEYAEALAEWSTENALKKRDDQESERKQQLERNKVINTWKERQEAVQSKYVDYAETLASSDVKVSNEVREAILESDIGPEILYHIAKNPAIAESLASKSTVSALREIGRLEAVLSGEKPAVEKPAVTTSKAPSPISPIRATKAVDTPLDSKGDFHGTYAQWKEARKAGKIK